jgi:Raf kinase inhibitor-like YbhB/YbcL family protein
MKYLFNALAVLILALSACGQAASTASDGTGKILQQTNTAAQPQPSAPLTLASTIFSDQGNLPAKYGQIPFSVTMPDGSSFACKNSAESTNVSPPLNWTDLPGGTASLVLIMGDRLNYAYPDMPPEAIFSHWVVYNLPPESTGLPEGLSANAPLPGGALQGKNDYPPPYDIGYGGPCPGAQKHLYIFTLYALDTQLSLPAGADMKTVLKAIQKHILAQAQLAGYYTGP